MEQDFTTPVAQLPINIQLGFNARYVVIDNASNQYIEEPTTGRVIAPQIFGVGVALQGTQQAQITNAAIPGITQSVPATGTVLSTWYDSQGVAASGVAPVFNANTNLNTLMFLLGAGGNNERWTAADTVDDNAESAGNTIGNVSLWAFNDQTSLYHRVRDDSDQFNSATAAGGAKATLTIPAPGAGKCICITWAAWTLLGPGGADAHNVTIDGTVVGGVSVPANGGDRFVLSDPRGLRRPANTACVLDQTLNNVGGNNSATAATWHIST